MGIGVRPQRDPYLDAVEAADEAEFGDWYHSTALPAAKKAGVELNPNPDDPLHYYDWRGAHRAGAMPDAAGHWPSTFKRLGHPNLIVDGLDTRNGQPATQALVDSSTQARFQADPYAAATETAFAPQKPVVTPPHFAGAAPDMPEFTGQKMFGRHQPGERISPEEIARREELAMMTTGQRAKEFGQGAAEASAGLATFPVEIARPMLTSTRDEEQNPLVRAFAAAKAGGPTKAPPTKMPRTNLDGTEEMVDIKDQAPRSAAGMVGDMARAANPIPMLERFIEGAARRDPRVLGEVAGMVAGGKVIEGFKEKLSGPQLSFSKEVMAPKDAYAARAFASKNPYEVLGLDRETATEAEINTAVRNAAKKWHPDLHPGDERATEVMARYNAAGTEASEDVGLVDRLRKSAPNIKDPFAAADAYRALGVGADASPAEIRAAFEQRVAPYREGGKTPNPATVASLEQSRRTAMQVVQQRTPAAAGDAYDRAAQATESPTAKPSAPPPAAAPTGAAPAPPPATPEAAAARKPGFRRKVADMIDPERAAEIQRLETEKRSIQRAAETDALTGLGNRAAFEKARPSADKDPKTVVLSADVNNFKAYNDQYGHLAGDELLKRIGRAVQNSGARGFRPGGDEFVGLAPADLGNEAARKIERDVGEIPVKLADGRTVNVSVSVSVGPDYAAADAGLQSAKLARKGEGGSARGEATESSFAVPPGVVRRRTRDIHRDPARFQFKQLGLEGVSGELKGVTTYNEKLAGVTSLWRDPADGLDYVINGHHRHELSERTGNEWMNVQYIDAKDATEARARGALINMAEGRGTSVDVAKFLRDMDVTPAALAKEGISLRADLVKDGLALSKLAPDIFDQVATAKIPQAWGVAIGEVLTDPMLQRETLKAVRTGKRLTQLEVKEIARQVRDAGSEALTQETMFGEETDYHALFVPKAQLAVAIKKRLSGDKRLFGYVSKEGRAEQLSQAGETQIDVDAAKTMADASARIEEVFDRLYTRSGPIADLMNAGARRVAHGETPGAVAGEIYAAIGDAVGREIAGGEGADTAGRGGERPVPEAPRSVADAIAADDATREGRVTDSSDEAQSGFALTSEVPPAPSPQFDLLGATEGTEASRSLKQTESASRGELEKLREQFSREKDPVRRQALAQQISEREKLVNRDKAISAEEMGARAAAETVPAAKDPVTESVRKKIQSLNNKYVVETAQSVNMKTGEVIEPSREVRMALDADMEQEINALLAPLSEAQLRDLLSLTNKHALEDGKELTPNDDRGNTDWAAWELARRAGKPFSYVRDDGATDVSRSTRSSDEATRQPVEKEKVSPVSGEAEKGVSRPSGPPPAELPGTVPAPIEAPLDEIQEHMAAAVTSVPPAATDDLPEAPENVQPRALTDTEKASLTAPVVQRTIEQSGDGATPEDIRALVREAVTAIREGDLSTKAADIRKWAEKVLGRPYSSKTWQTDDVFDAIEGAVNQVARDTFGPVNRRSVSVAARLEAMRQFEGKVMGARTRSETMVARMQFSTPLPIADAVAWALDVLANERVLEPSAGTGNLVNGLRGTDVSIDVNEIEARRVEVLRTLGFTPTSVDALTLPLTGRRYNAIAMNPPFGARSKGRYHGFEALPFDASDISQRFVYAAMQNLRDGGRLVAVMPQGVWNAAAAPFRKWLSDNHRLVAMLDSPEGIYETRGTDVGTTLLVVDKWGKEMFDKPPTDMLGLKAPTWGQWTAAIDKLAGGGAYRRYNGEGHNPAVDVPPTQVAPAGDSAKIPKKEARLESNETDSDTRPGTTAPGGGSAPAGATGSERSAESGRPASGSGSSVAPGRAGDADVVAGDAPGDRGPVAVGQAPGVVLGLAARRVEPRAGDSPQRVAELAAANVSPVFAPYARGIETVRNPHPRLVVETRSMAGMPAPPITSKFRSPAVEAAWGRPGAQGGVSDDQAELALRLLNAWDHQHGFLVADDVGVGKTREGAIAVLEALARGARRIVYTTKNQTNITDAMKEFRLVATGREDGQFPAELVFVGDYPNVRKGLESLPQPNKPVIYFAHAYNFAPFAEALSEVHPDTWIADEAHEYKNQWSDRGAAWQGLHKQMLAENGRFAYFTATPAVTLDELGYLYGLREWVPGGFADWVKRKLGYEAPETGEGDVKQVEADRQAQEREVGDRAGVEVGELEQDEAAAKKGKKRFMRGRPDVFAAKITPAETEQVMRELKGKGKYIARDLWRGGVKFDVDEVDLLGDGKPAVAARERYDRAAHLARDITMAARKFGLMNKKVKTTGTDRAMIQSYMKQLLFDLRLPRILELADKALDDGQQVVISVHSVAGDAELEEGLSEADSVVPLNKRLEAAINRINTQHIEKEGAGDEVEYIDLGEIPEAVQVRANLLDRLRELTPLSDPVRRVEDHFGRKNVAAITGKVPATARTKLMAEYQAGKRAVALISKAGKVGISLHDVNGRQRRMLVGDYEWSADLFKQELGRVDRTGQQSPPEITLVASNIAGERKFAATIAARMASLGATSKGSAEATGTDALDQFEMSGDIPLNAMKAAVENLPEALRQYFTGSKFLELKQTGETGQGREFVPKKRPDDADMRSFLLEMLMFPVKASDEVFRHWVAQRDELMTGEAEEKLAAKRTGRLHGEVLRQTSLSQDPPLMLFEVKNAAGEQRGIVQGFVTEFIADIQQARGSDPNGGMKSRRYVQFTDQKGGALLSGLEVSTGEARRIRQMMGAGDKKSLTPEEVFQDIEAGDKVKVEGPDRVEWLLSKRRDGRIQIHGATLAKHRDALQGFARFEPVGNFLFIKDEPEAVKAFLARFPVKRARIVPPGGAAPGDEPGRAGGREAGFIVPELLQPTKIASALYKRIGETEIADAITRLITPALRTPESAEAAHIIRHRLGELAHEFELAREKLGAFRKDVPLLNTPEGLAFVDAIESGSPQAIGKLDPAAKAIREVLDETRDEVQGLGKLEHFNEHYFPHIWDRNQGTFAKIFGKRPLEGSKSFLKRRSIPTIKAGIQAGLQPIVDNPLDMVLLKLREMQRYLMAHRILIDLREANLAHFVRAGTKAPDGYARINDKVATVFAPRTDEGAIAIRGEYWAPEPVALILNNYLSPGLRGNPLYDAYMALGNTLNQAQLGLSAFHLGFTSLDAAISRAALAVLHASEGRVLRATMEGVSVPISPVTNILKGRRVLRAYLRPGSQGSEMEAVVDALVKAGGRVKMDEMYKNNALEQFLKAVRRRPAKTVAKGAAGAVIGGAVAGPAGAAFGAAFMTGALGAALELAAKPIMEVLVPLQKLGVFYDLARFEIERLPGTATTEQARAAFARAWDSVDNRMGQVVYDNRFWNKALKDLGHASIRSLGWNWGTKSEVLGGVRDLSEGKLTPRASYVLALVTVVGLLGALINYLYTGEGPKELKDYYFPRTGRKGPDGNEERLSLPSYMKDIFAYARHPLRTLSHKLHPLIGAIGDMLSNTDFYGNEIRNPEEPVVLQAQDAVRYLGKQYIPLGVRGATQAGDDDQSGLTTALSFVGVTPAPREVVRTKAENEMSEYLARHRPASRTKEEAEGADRRRELRDQLRDKTLKPSDLPAMVRAGELTEQQARRMVRESREPVSVTRFRQLPTDVAMKVYDLGTVGERDLWYPILADKVRREDEPDVKKKAVAMLRQLPHEPTKP